MSNETFAAIFVMWSVWFTFALFAIPISAIVGFFMKKSIWGGVKVSAFFAILCVGFTVYMLP